MSGPSVSVIIPTYNRKLQTLNAIRSVLAQSYEDYELIVVDDGSSDGSTIEFGKLGAETIKVYQIEHSGVSKARNYGVMQSTGRWLAFLDSDDLWHPDKLERQIRFHQEFPDLRISQTKEIWIRNGKRVNPKVKHQKPKGYIFPESLHLCTITPSSVLMERSLFKEVGGFDETMRACEDYDLWLRITARYNVGLLEQDLMTRHGGHEDQLSSRYEAMDRFRVFSLGKVLLSGELTDQQQEQVLEVLGRKTEILLNGAEKRGLIFEELSCLFRQLLQRSLPYRQFVETATELLLSEKFYQS